MDKVFNIRQSHSTAPKEKKAERAPASAPLNHEIAGYMPGRKEFEVEHENDAEQMVKDMEFEETDTKEDVRLKSLLIIVKLYYLKGPFWIFIMMLSTRESIAKSKSKDS